MLSCAWKSALPRSSRFASRVFERGWHGHGDEGVRGDVSDSNISDWTRHRRTALLFFCLSLYEYPGDTGSIIRHTTQLFRHWNRYRHWRHIPPHRMQEAFGPRLNLSLASVMPTLDMFRGFGFPNARREEVDRLRVAMVSRVRGPGSDTFVVSCACGICC